MGFFDSETAKRAANKVRKQAGIPPIPKDASPDQRQFFQAIRENLAVRMGQEGDPLEQAVTFKDFAKAGMLKWSGGGVRYPGAPEILPPPSEELDYSPPPAPTNLMANGGLGIIFLTWDNPNLNYNYYTEVWRSSVDALDLESVEMKLVGSANGPMYVDSVGGDRTVYYYWVRFVKAIGTQLIYGPFNGTAGTLGQTSLDPAYVIELIEGLIGESELANELLTPIQAIPGIQTTLDNYGIRIPSLETTVGNHAVQIPSMQGLLDDYGPRINAAEGTIVDHNNDITNLQASVVSAELDIVANADAFTSLDTRVTVNETEISTQAGQITSLQSSLNDLSIPAFDANNAYVVGELFRYDNVVYEVIATQTQPNVTPPNVTYYDPRPDYKTIADTVSANSAAVSALDTRVTSAEGTITAQGTDITLLQSDVTTAQGDITANANATSSLATRVTSTENDIISASGDITTLQNSLTTIDGNVTSNANAIGSLQTEVTAIDGVITSQSTDITQLQNDLNAAELNITANASAITSLTTRVSATEGDISSQSTQLTSLNNELTAVEGDITANSQALTLLDSRVTTSEGTISTHTSQITQLQTDVTNLDVGGNAAALQQLDVRVTANETDITAIASDITNLEAGVGGNTAALQTKAEVSAVQNLEDDISVLSAQYTIKLDVNGRVAGIGLANVNGASEFIVASDAVYFIDPGSSIFEFDPAKNYSSMQELRDTQLVFGYANVEGQKRFAINVPAYIPDGTITTAQIENATITQAQIVDLNVKGADIDLLNVWEIASFNDEIKSIPFTSGTTGWRLQKNGNAEFSNATVRGHIEATTGHISDAVSIGGLGALAYKSSVFYSDVAGDKPEAAARRTFTMPDVSERFVCIAANPGSRAMATFRVWETASGRHNSMEFTIGASFGNGTNATFNLSSASRYSTNVFKEVRLYTNGTYGPMYVVVVCENLVNGLQIHVEMTGNVQSSGWNLDEASDTGYVPALGTFARRWGVSPDLVSAPNNWVRPNSTLIDGNKIFTGDAYVDTLQIQGNAISVNFSREYVQNVQSSSNTAWRTYDSFYYSHADPTSSIPCIFIFAAETYSTQGYSGNLPGVRIMRRGSVVKTVYPELREGTPGRYYIFLSFIANIPAGNSIYYIQHLSHTSGGGNGMIFHRTTILGAAR